MLTGQPKYTHWCISGTNVVEVTNCFLIRIKSILQDKATHTATTEAINEASYITEFRNGDDIIILLSTRNIKTTHGAF